MIARITREITSEEYCCNYHTDFPILEKFIQQIEQIAGVVDACLISENEVCITINPAMNWEDDDIDGQIIGLLKDDFVEANDLSPLDDYSFELHTVGVNYPPNGGLPREERKDKDLQKYYSLTGSLSLSRYSGRGSSLGSWRR